MSTIYPSNQYATAALKELRSILAGEVADLQAELTTKRETVHHVDVVPGLIAPDLDPAGLPARRAASASPYPILHLTRRVLAILRRRDAPMGTREVAEAIAAETGYAEDALPNLTKRARYTLRNLTKDKRKRVTKGEGQDGEPLWALS